MLYNFFLVNLKKVEIAEEAGKSININTTVLESLKVGQLVRVHQDELIPADLVLLKSSEADGMCFLETSAIDGESNLKIRQVLSQTQLLTNWNNSTIICDSPNKEIYNFQGSLQLNSSPTKLALDRNQFLPRGCFLVNTEWIIGVVVYTGLETKIMQNVNGTSRRKITKMDRLNDLQNAQIVSILVILVFLLFFGHIYYTNFVLQSHKYLQIENGHPNWLQFLWSYFQYFITFLLLLNNLVPISLSVTLEVVRAFLAHLINSDLEMYDEDLQMPSKAQSSNVLDELGRIQYIMTDKTGTLTRNQMTLKNLLINDQVYEDCLNPKNVLMKTFERTGQTTESIQQFLETVVLCHTVMIDKRNGKFQASSPDELALLQAAKQLGLTFSSRTSDKIIINSECDKDSIKSFSIKAVIEFTSDRKRMSVVVQDDESGNIFIVTKGADSAIFPRCSNSTIRGEASVEEFSLHGLRTLCFATRQIGKEEFEDWIGKWNSALNTFGPNRQTAIDSTADLIESNLQFIGVSGIEDRLQQGVPQAISTLLRANIKIWILTGDRAETATNTAYLCGLIKPHHGILKMTKLSDIESVLSTGTECPYVLIISGDVYSVISSDLKYEPAFVKLVSDASSLVACRLSPLQKSEITNFVQTRLQKTTLAIGDGGNDVGMIQAADVGIGINGLEGSQAARSADFSISQFRFLVKLLLVHGAWSFHRISRVILYMMYKNFLLVLVQFWYSAFNSFSGQSAFSSLFMMLFNCAFTVLPPFIIGVTDQYVTAAELVKHPQLYQFGQRGKFYDFRAFWECIANAVIQSLTMCATLYFLIRVDPVISNSGHPTSWQFISDVLLLISMMTVSVKVLLFTNFFTRLMSAALLSALFLCFLLVGFRSSPTLLTSPILLSAVILVPVLTLLRDFLWKFYRRQFKPRAYHIVQEIKAVEDRRSRRIKKEKMKLSKSASFDDEKTPLTK